MLDVRSGFCRAATLEGIRKHGHVLTPGRYVAAEQTEDDDEPFEKMARFSAERKEQMQRAARLDAAIWTNLEDVGYGR
jgi:type I restriction enzyme M protein